MTVEYLRRAGFSVAELHEADYSISELVRCCSLEELRLAEIFTSEQLEFADAQMRERAEFPRGRCERGGTCEYGKPIHPKADAPPCRKCGRDINPL